MLIQQCKLIHNTLEICLKLVMLEHTKNVVFYE